LPSSPSGRPRRAPRLRRPRPAAVLAERSAVVVLAEPRALVVLARRPSSPERGAVAVLAVHCQVFWKLLGLWVLVFTHRRLGFVLEAVGARCFDLAHLLLCWKIYCVCKLGLQCIQ
jgi:hypothetical protein